MNPMFSVRFRLFALCVSLLAVLGGANLLLGNINRQHEAQVLQLQEQYRRVNVIHAVQQGMSTFRYWQGQLNAAWFVKNQTAEQQGQLRLDKARGELEAHL